MKIKNIWSSGDVLPNFIGDLDSGGGQSMTPSLVGDYLQTSFVMIGSGNSFFYRDFTDVTDYTIQTGDYLEYDMYWQADNIMISVDLALSDGGVLRDATVFDQDGFSPHPNITAINSSVSSRWYHRRIPITTFSNGNSVGKSIIRFDIGCEYDSSATVVARFRNIQITDGSVNIPGRIYMRQGFQ